MNEASFRYVVTVRLRSDITEGSRKALLIELDRAMAAGPLPYRFERGLKLQPGAADYALAIDFASAEQLAAWNRPSAEHAAMKRLCAGAAEQVLVLCHAP